MEYRLRELRIDDAVSIAKYANNRNVSKFLTDAFPYPYTIENGLDFIARSAENDNALILAIEINGEVAGCIGVHRQSDIHRKNAELGYWLAEKYWGKGIVTGAILQIVDQAFEKFDINRIFARPFNTNPGSKRVLEKAGFKLEGRFEKTLIKDGEYLDELIYAIRV